MNAHVHVGDHVHLSVLPAESVAAIQEGSLAILERSAPGGQLLGLDADPRSIRNSKKYLARFQDSVLLVNENFSELQATCIKHDFFPVHGILFDLGLSSDQLANGGGFSFQHDAPLDMRFSPRQ